MTHQIAPTSTLIDTIVTAINGTTLNGGTVTATKQAGGHAMTVTQNFDGTAAYAKTWDVQFR